MNGIDADAVLRGKLLLQAKGLLNEMDEYLRKKYGDDYQEHMMALTIEERATYNQIVDCVFELMGGIKDEYKCPGDIGGVRRDSEC